jgi:hypothetical protein
MGAAARATEAGGARGASEAGGVRGASVAGGVSGVDGRVERVLRGVGRELKLVLKMQNFNGLPAKWQAVYFVTSTLVTRLIRLVTCN